MRTIHHSRTALSAVVAVLMIALSAPIAIDAKEQVIAEEQVLTAEEPDPALVPAVPSWDEMSGYGSVEASRAANALAASPVVITTQVPSDVRWAPERALEHAMDPLLAAAVAWDETSGYGSVEASRAEISALLSGEVISGQELALAMAAAAATLWDETSGYGSVEASRGAASALLAPVAAPSTCVDYIPAALASGQRAESAHLATVPLPGEDAVDGVLTAC